MDGRRSGTPGGDLAARRLADWLEAAGLRPGGERESFFQSFVVAPGARVTTGSILRPVDGAALQVGRDWTPHGGSLREHVTGEIAFVGYGVSAPASGYDDWAGIDVRDRIVLALDGAPAHLGSLRTSRLEKLIAARRAGARALLIVGDRLPALSATVTAVRLVSGTLTPAAADILLAPDASIARLTTTIAERRAPASFVAPRRVEIAVALEAADRTAVNVVGILPGRDPALAGEAVVLGAHYDHLGLTGGAIYPGADDNASGTAVVVGLARAFAAAGGLDRTLVFVLFGAEEIGLVGSGHYVRHPTVPLARTVAMLNFDMVGRLHDANVRVSGTDSGSTLREVAGRAAADLGVRADLRGSPFGPSDHSRFYAARCPGALLSHRQPSRLSSPRRYGGQDRRRGHGADRRARRPHRRASGHRGPARLRDGGAAAGRSPGARRRRQPRLLRRARRGPGGVRRPASGRDRGRQRGGPRRTPGGRRAGPVRRSPGGQLRRSRSRHCGAVSPATPSACSTCGRGSSTTPRRCWMLGLDRLVSVRREPA